MAKITKEEILKVFDRVKKAFPDEEKTNTIFFNEKLNQEQLRAISKILYVNNEKVPYNHLIMLLGGINVCFPAGNYGFNKEQNIAINDLLDLAYTIDHEQDSV